MKLLMMTVFGVAFMLFPVLIASPIRSFIYDWAPLKWFVDIQGVAAAQEDNDIVVHTLTRTVHKELRGKYQRTLFCSESESEYAIFIASGDITFDKKPIDKAVVRYAIDERFEGCSVFFFESIYYLIMPNGTERKYDTLRTADFNVVHGGVYKMHNPSRQFAPPTKTTTTTTKTTEKANTPSKTENNTTVIYEADGKEVAPPDKNDDESDSVINRIENIIDDVKSVKLPLGLP